MKICRYHTPVFNHHDPYKDYGRCTNKNSANYGKPVFENECQVHCIGRGRLDDSVYIDSILIPDGFTERLSKAMLLILEFPKDKRIKNWKKSIEISLKILLHKFSKEAVITNNRVVIKSLNHHADELFEILNKDGKLSAYKLQEYKVGEEIRWVLLLNVDKEGRY